MQLLPFLKPKMNDIPELSRLMCEAYSESRWNRYPNVAAAEKSLRSLFSKKKNNDPARESSFMSKAGDKIVSACLVQGEQIGATVSELFTHPLYRARGLATTELTACMSSLALAKVRLLRISADEENHVLIRLLSKLGFVVDIKYSIMVRG
jgi:predicted GNAT family acetyltransferase